ncbi:MAG: hypothetical protein K9K93_02520 [Acholeplasmataceae bacterium]|nr:hypothetical protein [Acholeplasmataceae bacterium]
MIEQSRSAAKKQAFQHTMFWIGTGALAIALIKVLVQDSRSEDLLVEIFVLATTSLYLIVGQITRHRTGESGLNPLQYGLIWLLLFGGFFVHFVSVSIAYHGISTLYQATNLLLSFAMIILIIQFRKRHLYLHERLLGREYYILNIFKRIALFGVIFSINLIPIFYYEARPLMMAVIFSYLSMSLTYLLFALYEMYDHQDMILLSQHKMAHMSKTIVLILFIPVLYTFVEYAIQHAVTYDVFFKDQHLSNWIRIQMLIKWIGINVFIYVILAWSLMILHLRKLPINRMISKLVLLHLILNVMSFVYGTTINLFMDQIIERYMDQITNIGLFVSRLSHISLSFMFAGLLLTVLIWLFLYRYRLKGQIFLLLSAVIPLVLYFARNLSMAHHNVTLFMVVNIIGFLAIPLFYIFLIIQTRSFVDLEDHHENELTDWNQDEVHFESAEG